MRGREIFPEAAECNEIRKGDAYATIRNMIVGEAAAQKTKMTEQEIKESTMHVFRLCKEKGKEKR